VQRCRDGGLETPTALHERHDSLAHLPFHLPQRPLRSAERPFMSPHFRQHGLQSDQLASVLFGWRFF
jgi:hypothetical protein